MHHTSKVVDGIEYNVNHNADWSGPAYVLWEEHGEVRQLELPGEVLRACGRAAAFSEVISAVESAIQQLGD
jgi:hypothetical protein